MSIKTVFHRELCSKFLKEALLLLFLLFLAWNQVKKMLQMEQKVFANKKCFSGKKNVREQILFQIKQKKLQKERKMFAMKIAF